MLLDPEKTIINMDKYYNSFRIAFGFEKSILNSKYNLSNFDPLDNDYFKISAYS